MCFYPTSPKYPIDHFRCLVACSISADPALPARFCCWTCRQPGEGGSAKNLWPSFTSYSWHWNLTHARQVHKDWISLALHGGVTLQDLAWSLLGVDLDGTPLPYHKDALRHLPRTLPPREQGHSPKIYGHHGTLSIHLLLLIVPCLLVLHTLHQLHHHIHHQVMSCLHLVNLWLLSTSLLLLYPLHLHL